MARITHSHRIAFSAARVFEMLHDRAYYEAKYTNLPGNVGVDVQRHAVIDQQLEVAMLRTVEVDLPELAKRLLGRQSQMLQKESWRPDGRGGFHADVQVDSPGKPIRLRGTMRLVPDGEDACRWEIDFDISAQVPLIGGKIEKMVGAEALAGIIAEASFNDRYLAR